MGKGKGKAGANPPPPASRIPHPRRRHEEVAERLREMIRTSLGTGARLPSVRTLMATFGVSMTSLRAAQAVLAHEGLIEVRHGHGVRVAVPTCRPVRVGVLTELDPMHPAGGGHFRDLARLLLHVLRARGFSPRLYTGTVCPGEMPEAVSCPEFWEDAGNGHLDAAVLLNTPATDSWYWRVQELRLPAVGSMTRYVVPHGSQLTIAPGLRELQARGARRLALIAWDLADVATVFEQTVRDLGLTTRREWMAGGFHPSAQGSGWEAFRELWAACPEKPDGLLIADDVFFADTARAIRELGITVPGELSVVTHANHPAPSQPCPFAHTRIVFDAQAHAEALVALLTQRLAGAPPPATALRLPHSVADAPASAVPVMVHTELGLGREPVTLRTG